MAKNEKQTALKFQRNKTVHCVYTIYTFYVFIIQFTYDQSFCDTLPGEPKGPVWFGPLYCGVDELGGPGKFAACGGAGPGVEDPDGAGEEVY